VLRASCFVRVLGAAVLVPVRRRILSRNISLSADDFKQPLIGATCAAPRISTAARSTRTKHQARST
jgi:hypothetical protein